eukprot:14856452-Alexandrium_andersonii.AAC.1
MSALGFHRMGTAARSPTVADVQIAERMQAGLRVERPHERLPHRQDRKAAEEKFRTKRAGLR